MNLNPAMIRRILPHALFAAAPMVAIAVLFHAPLRADLADKRARLASLRALTETADLDAPSIADVERAIRDLGRSAASSPNVYESITAAARLHAVRVDSISPSTPPAPLDDAAPSETLAFSIVAFGGFDNLVRFVAELETGACLTSVRSLQIEPARSNEPGLLQAIIETAHTRYTLAASTDEESSR